MAWHINSCSLHLPIPFAGQCAVLQGSSLHSRAELAGGQAQSWLVRLLPCSQLCAHRMLAGTCHVHTRVPANLIPIPPAWHPPAPCRSVPPSPPLSRWSICGEMLRCVGNKISAPSLAPPLSRGRAISMRYSRRDASHHLPSHPCKIPSGFTLYL